MRARRMLAAGLLVGAVLLTAACSESSSLTADDTGGPDVSRGSGSAGPSPSAQPSREPTAPVLNAAYAVKAPGPLQTPLFGPDLLVYNQGSLSQDTLAALRRIPGVTHVEPFSMAQVSIENKAINLAAVDAGAFRRFTPAASAQTQAVWDRVAAGELALRPALRKRVPSDKEGYLRLGNGEDAPQVHIGAFAPQFPQIDAVVNEKWASRLGMKTDNAVVIATGTAAPQDVRAAVQRLAGDEASVQLLGPDLDITVQQTAFLVGSVADAVGTFNYTVLGGGRIAPDPAWVTAHIATAAVPILGNVTCNRMVFPQLRAALQEVVDRGLADTIDPSQYAGCYYPRFIAGSTKLSNHSFGLALDLNTPGNQRGTVGEMNRTVVSIFKRWGFTWGGDWAYTDPMHFEMNAVVDPR